MNTAPSVIVSKESALAYECTSPLVNCFNFFLKKLADDKYSKIEIVYCYY